MADFMRHVGRTANTDRRLVVVYMQIPGREDHALVVDTDALPPHFHDELMDVVQGDGQRETVLANVLGRRVMAYSGQDILSSLHQAGKLVPMPVNQILMLPQPNHPVPLTEVIKYMNNNTNQPTQQAVEEVRDNRIIENQNIDKNDQQYQIAANIIAEAEMLEDEAKRKREQAYKMYPALRPAVKKVEIAAPTEANEVVKEVKPKTTRKPAAKKTTA